MSIAPIDPARCWGGVYPILGPKLPAIAKRIEASGRYGILAGQSWGPPWIPLAAAAAVTERVQLACSVAIAGVRSPFETAFAALDMDRISNGRFALGSRRRHRQPSGRAGAGAKYQTSRGRHSGSLTE